MFFGRRWSPLDSTLHPAATARTCRLGTVEEAPQQMRQNHKDQGVQQQTAHLGNALACGDPATCNLTGQLERLGAGNGNERGKWDDLLDGIHFIKSIQNFYRRGCRNVFTGLKTEC